MWRRAVWWVLWCAVRAMAGLLMVAFNVVAADSGWWERAIILCVRSYKASAVDQPQTHTHTYIISLSYITRGMCRTCISSRVCRSNTMLYVLHVKHDVADSISISRLLAWPLPLVRFVLARAHIYPNANVRRIHMEIWLTGKRISNHCQCCSRPTIQKRIFFCIAATRRGVEMWVHFILLYFWSKRSRCTRSQCGYEYIFMLCAWNMLGGGVDGGTNAKRVSITAGQNEFATITINSFWCEYPGGRIVDAGGVVVVYWIWLCLVWIFGNNWSQLEKWRKREQ